MMKVTCNHCGARNDLGRIFCLACGKRMKITNEEVEDARKKHQAVKIGSLFKPLLIVLFLAVLGLLAWPRKPFLDQDQAKRFVTRARVATKVSTLATSARLKREAIASFDEEELNVYFQTRPVPPEHRGLEPFSVRLIGGSLFVMRKGSLGPFKIGEKNFGPFSFTREVKLTPDHRTLRVTGGSLNHFPLPGPLSMIVSGPMSDTFSLSAAEQSIEKQLESIAIEDGKLEIMVGP